MTPSPSDLQTFFGEAGVAALGSCTAVTCVDAEGWGRYEAEEDSILGFRTRPETAVRLDATSEVIDLCRALLDPTSYGGPLRFRTEIFYSMSVLVFSDGRGSEVPVLVEQGALIQSVGGCLAPERSLRERLHSLREAARKARAH